MKFELEISLDGAAFEDPAELTRLLHRLAVGIENRPEGWDAGNVMDVNGNNVGEWRIS